jgi:hypothetical protein
MTVQVMEKPALSRSEEQAMAQLESIQLWHEVSEWASREGEPCELPMSHRKWLRDEMDWAYDPDHEAVFDGIRDLVSEDPLSVQVRSDWHDLGDTPEAAEFNILLCTGGPAVRILGELTDEQVSACRLQHQDWGTPWTEVVSLTKDQRDALEWYCEQFYWGDC